MHVSFVRANATCGMLQLLLSDFFRARARPYASDAAWPRSVEFKDLDEVACASPVALGGNGRVRAGVSWLCVRQVTSCERARAHALVCAHMRACLRISCRWCMRTHALVHARGRVRARARAHTHECVCACIAAARVRAFVRVCLCLCACLRAYVCMSTCAEKRIRTPWYMHAARF